MKTDIICDDEYEAQKLMSLIFIKEDKETFITGILNVIKNEMYKDFYMHKTGHWLGLDVHDVGEYENIKFLPGMVITVEPGIYIDQSNINVEKKWRGIGVRIEDDVVIQAKGDPLNLMQDIPIEIEEIEELMNN